jgi:hypothetical protein
MTGGVDAYKHNRTPFHLFTIRLQKRTRPPFNELRRESYKPLYSFPFYTHTLSLFISFSKSMESMDSVDSVDNVDSVDSVHVVHNSVVPGG